MSELFCSKVISEITPSARSIIAVNLLKKGMTQKNVSEILKITQPAISQYKSGMRGLITEKMQKNRPFVDYLDKLTELVYKDNLDINMKTCEICKNARKMNVVGEKEIREFLCLLEIARKN
jgi:hypothetical protein